MYESLHFTCTQTLSIQEYIIVKSVSKIVNIFIIMEVNVGSGESM